MAGSLAKAVHGARKAHPEMAIEVECRNLDEVSYALGTGADLLLLDNMDTETLREAVRLRDENSPAGKGPSLEASGGVSLETVRAIAETGVDLISVGALTHSAPTLDFSLLIEESVSTGRRPRGRAAGLRADQGNGVRRPRRHRARLHGLLASHRWLLPPPRAGPGPGHADPQLRPPAGGRRARLWTRSRPAASSPRSATPMRSPPRASRCTGCRSTSRRSAPG